MSDSVFKRAVNRTFVGLEKEKNQHWKGPFRFIQAADCQFGLIDELKYVDWSAADRNIPIQQSKQYKAKVNSIWTEEIRLSKLAIEQWNQMQPKPRFAIICGDLVNEFPGRPQRDDQIRDMKKTYAMIDQQIPLILLPGNHDIGDCPRPETIQEYRQDFGDDYFAFWIDGVMFIVINSQYYKDGSETEVLADEQERWIDERLVEAKQGNYKHIVVFQHIPWFLNDVDEPVGMFNIAIEERIRMLKKFNDYGVRAIFAGHYHRNAGGKFEEMEIVVTSALGAQITDPDKPPTKSGYRIVEVGSDRIEHRYVQIEQ